MRAVSSPRPFCYSCRRALVLCVCGDVKPVPTRTRLVFLQHAEEAWNQIGTARLAHLSLPNSVLIEGRSFEGNPVLDAALADDREVLLLYPSRDAVSLGDLEPGLERTLIVIDGTWSQARNVVNHTPALRGVKRVRLPPGAKSRYRIRMQPRAECVSSLEAAVRALTILEGEEARFEPILAAFDRMVDRHIARAAACGRTIVRDRRAEIARRPLPAAMAGDMEGLVLCHGETLNARSPSGSIHVDLVQWCALHVASGEVFDGLVAGERTLVESELRYLGLPSFDGALDRDEFARQWASFARPEFVYLSWGFFASNALASVLDRKLAPQTDLRRATKHILNRKVRWPEDALLELEVAQPASIARGRGGSRLAAIREIVFSLRGLSAAVVKS
jgi:DTW domain-containing protein YfiP